MSGHVSDAVLEPCPPPPLLSWAYAVCSVILVIKLSFSSMERDSVDEVSFTRLASSTLGADLEAITCCAILPAIPPVTMLTLGFHVVMPFICKIVGIQSTFSSALDFAGVYENCFLFGMLPPVMAWIHRSHKRIKEVSWKIGSVVVNICRYERKSAKRIKSAMTTASAEITQKGFETSRRGFRCDQGQRIA
ncbi:hypothetical protein HU200_040846 [Digitaria exilis]|uniref:Uncharacterized protein n=1 Tax=Digitaria exilis TaxID=1010633 RepID=A0A835B9B0_9POAL|nr:hypothetical protein HU200_040846 [Digitaria exilis]